MSLTKYRNFSWLALVVLMETTAQSKPDYAELSGIVRVSSTYQNFGPDGGKQRVEGTGFTLSIPTFEEFTFVVTAAHVASGDIQPTKDNVTVEWFDPVTKMFRHTKPIFRYLIAGQDVAILMLAEKDLPLFANYEPSADKFGIETAKANPFGIIVQHESTRTSYQFIGGARESFFRLGERAFVPLAYDYLEARKSPFADLTPSDFARISSHATPEFAQLVRYGFSEGEFEWSSYAPFAPGMSGAPILLHNTPSNSNPLQNILLGMAGADSRYFTKSWIIPQELMVLGIKQFTSYFDGQMKAGRVQLPWRYNADHVFWRYYNGILFREGSIPRQKITYREIILNKSCERGEVGNGTRADVGNGTRADVGKLEMPSSGRTLTPGAEFTKNGVTTGNVVAFAVNYSHTTKLVAANSGGLQAVLALDGLQLQGDIELKDLTIKPLSIASVELIDGIYARILRAFPCVETDQIDCELEAERVVPITSVVTKKVHLVVRRDHDQLRLRFAIDDKTFETLVDAGTYKPVLEKIDSGSHFTLELENLSFDAFDSAKAHFSLKIGNEEYWVYGR